MRVSEKGIEFISQFEGFSPTVYVCPAGYETVGYGHRIRAGEKFGNLSRSEAKDLLMTDMEDVELRISDMIETEINQEQFDACASLAMNIGPNAFAKSTLLRMLNDGDPQCSKQFDRFVFSGSKRLPGLVARRAAERVLFDTGNYGD